VQDAEDPRELPLRSLVLRSTALRAPAAVPELRLHLTGDLTELWEQLQRCDPQAPPPYWSVAWLGGQVLARYVLDSPAVVIGRRVLDLATGSGLVALAAARAGAAVVTAVDVDPVAAAAVRLNAQANRLRMEVVVGDLLDGPVPDVDLVLAGDVCYEQPMADRAVSWLRAAVASGTEVLVGDPGRDHLPRHGLEVVSQRVVPTSRALEGVERKQVRVLRLSP
jgi:predicted nicotinamide N-methyase